MAKKRRDRQHVRLYAWELETEAYRSLGCPARALLIEMRALYNGGENRVFMSRREAERRLGVGRKQAEQAITELTDRGFIRLIERGTFSRKVRHATVYALTNETDDDGPAPKDYARWTKNHVAPQVPRRGSSGTTTTLNHTPKKGSRGSLGTTSEQDHSIHGVPQVPTDSIPGGVQ